MALSKPLILAGNTSVDNNSFYHPPMAEYEIISLKNADMETLKETIGDSWEYWRTEKIPINFSSKIFDAYGIEFDKTRRRELSQQLHRIGFLSNSNIFDL